MIQVEEMNTAEAEALLEIVGYGHLGCSLNDVPYVVPVHYVFDKPELYIYKTEGKKYEMIQQNPHICLQVEDVHNEDDWKSVVVTGKAVEVIEANERERALALITKRNPTLTPAISIRWMDDWIRENREVIYRIDITSLTGRYSVKLDTKAAFAPPRSHAGKTIN